MHFGIFGRRISLSKSDSEVVRLLRQNISVQEFRTLTICVRYITMQELQYIKYITMQEFRSLTICVRLKRVRLLFSRTTLLDWRKGRLVTLAFYLL